MSEDLISRQAAIDAILIKYTEYERLKMLHFTPNIIKQECADLLTDLPSVTPKQRTGHWIEHPEIETSAPEYIMFYECSECGDKQCFCKSNIHRKHFCNNCGAKMVDPQESEGKS